MTDARLRSPAAGSSAPVLARISSWLGQWWFPLVFALICIAFWALQWAYIHKNPLIMDEYMAAHESYLVVRKTPYLEYAPYKTVLARYPQAWLMHGASDTWSGLIAAKEFLVLLNVLMVVVGGWTLARVVRKEAVIGALVLLCSMSTFVERSHELRVDMMTAWGGFASLLLLLRGRFRWAGVLAAISFLASQKGAYYVVAGGMALLTYWLLVRRDRQSFRHLLEYGLSSLAVLVAYLLVWGIVAGFPAVLSATFVADRTHDVLFRNVYRYDLGLKYWGQSMWRNPFFYVALFAGLWWLDAERRRRREDQTLWIVVVYAIWTMGLCFWHPKPWPYFLVFLFPTAFVVHAFFFDRLVASRPSRWYVLGLTPIAIVAFGALGLWRPLARVPGVLKRDNAAHQHTLALAEVILDDEDTYAAGINFLYDRDQPPSFDNLGAPNLATLKRDKAARDRAIAELRESPVKIVIQSYRMEGLPTQIKSVIADTYEPLWGSIDIYSPWVPANSNAGPTEFELRFTGTYRVTQGTDVTVDGRKLRRGDEILLGAGRHEASAAKRFRLQLRPEGFEALADPKFRRPSNLFPRVYNY